MISRSVALPLASLVLTGACGGSVCGNGSQGTNCQSPVLNSVSPRISVPGGGDLLFTLTPFDGASVTARLTKPGCSTVKQTLVPMPPAKGQFKLKLNSADVGTCKPGDAQLEVYIDDLEKPVTALVHLYQPPNFIRTIKAPATQADAHSRAVVSLANGLYVIETDKNDSQLSVRRSHYKEMAFTADATFNADKKFYGLDHLVKVGISPELLRFYGPPQTGAMNADLSVYSPDNSRQTASRKVMPGDGCLMHASQSGQRYAIANGQQVTLFKDTWSPDSSQLSTAALSTCMLPQVAQCPNVGAPGQTHVGLMLSDFGQNAPDDTSAVTISFSAGRYQATLCGPAAARPDLLPCLNDLLKTLSLADAPPAFALSDIDGDKLPDLVYVLQDKPTTLYWIPYVGATDPGDSQSCVFGKTQSVSLAAGLLSKPSSISIADFNEDGLPDLAVADQQGVSVLFNQ